MGIPRAAYQLYVDRENAALAREKELQKYYSFDSADHTAKLEKLKDLKLNPYLLSSGYDGLTNSLQRWKTIATSSEALKATPEQKRIAAENYYDKMLVPMYQKMGAEPINKKVWMEQAYDNALKWDMDKAYESHWRTGLYQGFINYEKMGTFALKSLAGVGKSLIVDTRSMMGLDTPKEVKEGTPETYPITGFMLQSLKRTLSHDTFWHDINPDQTTGDGVKSFVVEQAMMLPLYATVGKFTGGFLGGLTSEEANTTKNLLATKGGKRVVNMLVNGAEGAAYGLALRDEGDKQNAWKDAVMQAVIGTVFHAAGEKLQFKSPKVERDIELGKKGYRLASIEELEHELMKSSAGVQAAGGWPLKLESAREAFLHVRHTEGMEPAYVENMVRDNLTRDKARYNDVYITAAYIRKWLGERKLSSLPENEMGELMDNLHGIFTKAADRTAELVPEHQEINGAKAVEIVQKTKSGAKNIARIIANHKADDAEVGIKRSEEEYQKIALAQIAKSNAKAAGKASVEQTTQPVSDVIDIVQKGQKLKKAKIEDPGFLKIRSSYRTNKGGEPAVSYSANMSWAVHARKAVTKAGFNWDSKGVQAWLDGLSSEDFTKDLHDFWFPEELKNEGIYFEGGRTENPNFLAFMRNYADEMPKEYAQRLDEELQDTKKVENFFVKHVPIEDQLDYYAKGMYNHVSDFMASERFKKPNAKGETRNVYRTTYANLKDPSRHQIKMHKEVVQAEQDIIRGMFKGKQGASNAAIHAYNLLAGKRAEAFMSGNQDTRREVQKQIDDKILEYSKGKYVRRVF